MLHESIKWSMLFRACFRHYQFLSHIWIPASIVKDMFAAMINIPLHKKYIELSVAIDIKYLQYLCLLLHDHNKNCSWKMKRRKTRAFYQCRTMHRYVSLFAKDLIKPESSDTVECWNFHMTKMKIILPTVTLVTVYFRTNPHISVCTK